MVTIKNEIIDTLRATTFTYQPKEVRDYYSTRKMVYPLVAIDELDNIDKDKILDKTYYSELTYTIEVYNKDMVLDKTLVSKTDVAFTICKEIDEVLKNKYGLTRVSTPVKILLDDDNTVLRTILTYRCSIDNENQITYR